MEWCAVWKGTVSECLGHLQEKHEGSQHIALQNVTKFFPPWTVPLELWQTALRGSGGGCQIIPRIQMSFGE